MTSNIDFAQMIANIKHPRRIDTGGGGHIESPGARYLTFSQDQVDVSGSNISIDNQLPLRALTIDDVVTATLSNQQNIEELLSSLLDELKELKLIIKDVL